MLIFPQLLSMFFMYLYYKKPYMHFYLFCIIAGIVCFLLTGGLDLIKGYINLFNNGSTDLGLGFRYWELKLLFEFVERQSLDIRIRYINLLKRK